MDLKFKDNNKLKLATFIQLEYIESTGTQYIDTGIVFSKGFTIETTFTPKTIDGNNHLLMGAYSSNSNNLLGITGNNLSIRIGNDTTHKYGNFVENNEYTIRCSNANNKITCVINDLVYAENVSQSGNYSSNTAYLFAVNSSVAAGFISCKLKRTKLYNENGILIRDFIPTKDNNNVVCLYDTVSEQFFYNEGTGDFIAGPAVTTILPETILLKTTTILPETILLKTTTIYHKNTPNVNGLQLIKSILDYQKTHQDEILLNRIRADIGNVEGPISYLMEFASMAGFNDNYEPQSKPRLVGTWTINDWYTTAQLAQAQVAFDGLTIVSDPNYLINFSNLAIQTLDSNEDNYNPAVAIILQGQSLGVTFATAPISGQTGRWMLTKTQAAKITSISNWFKSKTNVTDTNGIVTSDVTATYAFTSFDEFQYFSGVTTGCALEGSSGVKYITLPPNFTTLNSRDWWGINFIRVTLNEIATNLGTYWNVAYNGSIQNLIYRSIEQASKFKLVNNDSAITVNNVYVNDTLLTELTIDDSITDIGYTKVLGTSLTKIILHNNITSVNISNTSVSTVGLVGSGADIELPTSVTTFGPSKSLTSLELPSSITNLSPKCFYDRSVGPQNFLIIPSGVTVIPSYCFSGMTGINIIELQGNVTKFDPLAFYTGNCVVHLCGTTIPTIVDPQYYTRKTYVGLGQSQADDEALLATFRADSTWSNKNLDTWYNYLHPQS